ncbi:MAG: hypothetical protein KAH04_03290, partial [Psychrilyobacter sp.]|nr:hypothetical protein [Psychrilyobacter sp.]
DKKIETFNTWTKTPTDKAISDKTPKISLSDLKDSKIQTVDTTVETIDGVKIINNDINTYDINLTSLKFDASGFTSQDKINGDLFSILMTSSSTTDYTYEELSENLTKYFFALNASNSNNIIDNKHTSRKYSVYFEYLQEDNKEVYKTLENILFKGNFDNKLEIKNRLSSLRDSIINNSSDSGVVRSISVMKALAMTDSNYTYSLENKIAGKFTSTLMIDTLNAILNNYDVEYPKLQKTMIATREKLFNKTNMLVFYANRGNYENFKTDITPLLSNIKTEAITPTNYGKLEPNKLAIVVPVQNGSTSWANNLENLGYDYSGKYKVMANILDDYLNTNIRIQNGAYGAWFYITLSKNLIATTYRDGEVDKTLKAFTLMPEYLKGLKEMPQDVFDGFVLKSMAKYYQSYTPDQLMNLSYTHYLYNITLDDLEKEKNEVLATTKGDLPEFETIITKFIAAKHYSTVNSEAIIKGKGSNSEFDKTVNFKDMK